VPCDERRRETDSGEIEPFRKKARAHRKIGVNCVAVLLSTDTTGAVEKAPVIGNGRLFTLLGMLRMSVEMSVIAKHGSAAKSAARQRGPDCSPTPSSAADVTMRRSASLCSPYG
jgi:hypothetical protein